MKRELLDIFIRGLDQAMEPMQAARSAIKPPTKGWLRAVREALNLSQRAVSANLGIKQQPYANIERREARGTVTLDRLQRAAEALECDLVYFLIPKAASARTFRELALLHDPHFAHLKATEHSMALEGQAVGDLPKPPPAQSIR